jgi:WD40 repeat protein
MGNVAFGTVTNDFQCGAGDVQGLCAAHCGPCHNTCGLERIEVKNSTSDILHEHDELSTVTTTLSPTGAVVFCAYDDGTVKAWVCMKDKPTASFCCFQKSEEMTCLSIEEKSFQRAAQNEYDPFRLCGGTRNGFIQLWELDVISGLICPTARWRAHHSTPIQGMPFSGTSALVLDGDAMLSGGADGTVARWPDESGKGPREEWQRTHDAHRGAVTSICHTEAGPSKDFTLTAGEDGAVKAWTTAGHCQLPPHPGQTGAIHCLTLETDKQARCCAGCADNIVRLWDLAANRATLRFGSKALATDFTSLAVVGYGIPRHSTGVLTTGFDEANPARIISGHADRSVCIWDVRSGFGGSHCMLPAHKIAYHSEPVVSVAVHGDLLLAASLDGTASFWDLRATGAPDQPFKTLQLSKSSSTQPVMTSVMSERRKLFQAEALPTETDATLRPPSQWKVSAMHGASHANEERLAFSRSISDM